MYIPTETVKIYNFNEISNKQVLQKIINKISVVT